MPVTGDPNIVDKTASTTNNSSTGTTVPVYQTANAAQNSLNSYRSYTYRFTLAALPKEALVSEDTLNDPSKYYVVAKSGGKGSAGLNPPINSGLSSSNTSTVESFQVNSQLVSQFNTSSPGRFDFYFNNINITTLPAANEKGGMTIATNISFDIIEPYSMTGLIEALHVASVAAGYASYADAPFLFKIEFLGYPDNEDLPDPVVVSAENSTRNFVIGISSMEIDVNEQGTKYKCTAVSFEQLKGLGEASRLRENIKVSGNSVKDIIKSFEAGINKSVKDNAEQSYGKGTTFIDQYQFFFPDIVNGKYDTGKENKIADPNVQLIELLKSSVVYAFPDPATRANTSTNTVRLDPVSPSFQFAKDADIQDCITSVIRDSTYVKNILKTLGTQSGNPDAKGMVDYFAVHLEVEHTGIYNDKDNRPVFIYRYLIVPYKIHYTRFQPKPTNIVDTAALQKSVNRAYNYFYTGKNVDIINFKLKFDLLFFNSLIITI